MDEKKTSWAYCDDDCPMHPNALTTDDTLKVSHHYDQKELMIALKLYGIMASSLLLIGLMVTGLGSTLLTLKYKI